MQFVSGQNGDQQEGQCQAIAHSTMQLALSLLLGTDLTSVLLRAHCSEASPWQVCTARAVPSGEYRHLPERELTT